MGESLVAFLTPPTWEQLVLLLVGCGLLAMVIAPFIGDWAAHVLHRWKR